MDIYIVLDGSCVVGASARLQGAELIRANEARRISVDLIPEADPTLERVQARYRTENSAYERMQIVNVELQDMDD